MNQIEQNKDFTCLMCLKPHKRNNAIKKHRITKHTGQYGQSQIKQQRSESQQQVHDQQKEIEELKQKLKIRDEKIGVRIAELQRENTALKNQIAKLGKKKCAQAKVEAETEMQSDPSTITKNYADYTLNIFNKIMHMQFLNFEFYEKYPDVVIVDLPFADTMLKLPNDVKSDKDLMTLEIEQVQKNGLLCFWVTNKKLEFGLEFLKNYKYTYISMIVWGKIDDNGNFTGGPGYYFDHHNEIRLIAKKGQNYFDNVLHTYPNIIKAQRREASRKPDQLYHILKVIIPNAKILELFAYLQETITSLMVALQWETKLVITD